MDEYINRQSRMAVSAQLRDLQRRHVELARELGYYKAQNERLKASLAKMEREKQKLFEALNGRP